MMRSATTINQHLKQLGDRLGIGNLSLDSEGFCGLVWEDKLQLNIELLDEEDLVCFHISLMKAPVKDREAFYRRLLELNLFCYETNGSTFALNPETDEIILCQSVSVSELSYPKLEGIVNSMLSTAEYWQGELSKYGAIEEPVPRPVREIKG